MRKLYLAHLVALIGFLSVLFNILYGYTLPLFDSMTSLMATYAPRGITLPVAQFVAARGDLLVLMALSAIIFTRLYQRKKIAEIVAFVSAVVVSDFFVIFVKDMFSRTRPEIALYSLSNPSFPSGHATVAMVFFSLTYLLLKKEFRSHHKKALLGIYCAFGVALIAGSRVLLNVHWASDVLGGLFLGAFFATLTVIVLELTGDHIV